ncbi:MAG: hypothetical protein FGM24_02730 [Candidatus Kapabacteria bacterium]|nr:hypothetical protein [Candidatus Kapabacteria bacterium]
MHLGFRLSITLAVAIACTVAAIAGDTIRVKTLTFDDITKRSGTWQFPPKQRYEKVLMEYTLKCDPRTTQDRFDCGEWDYLTYTFVTDSTGEYDSTQLSQVNYVVRRSTPDSLPYRTTPVPLRRRFRTFTATRAAGATGDWVTVGSGGQNNTAILDPQGSRARYIWKASELSAAGLSAGAIKGIRLRGRAGVTATMFTVAMKLEANAVLPRMLDNAGFTTVIRRSVTFGDSLQPLPLTTPFTWDGTSDIVVDIACLGTSALQPVAIEASAGNGLTTDASRYAYSFTNGDVIVVDSTIGTELSNEITIAFWSWGDAKKMPLAHNTMEAYDSAGRRVVNIHLPWDNGTVYWDCGYNPADGAVDRIEKAAPVESFEGQWNHWAFTKSASGIMRVYCNGKLFHEGNGKTRSMKGIRKFLIGSGGSASYEGLLDEFQVWNKALDSNDIKSYMHRSITPSHPLYDNLIAYFTAENDNDPAVARDMSSSGYHGQMVGRPTRTRLHDAELGYMTASNGSRPVMGFETGDVTTTSTRRDIEFEIEAKMTSVILYDRPVESRIYRPDAADHPSVPTDTILVQLAGTYVITDEFGVIQDSISVPAVETLRKKSRTYYSPIVTWEIGRYITPYGIGLDLGPNGFKWIYDVTDYAPILRDNVTISAGNQQELIDLTFVFIKGTPIRDVKQIDQLWGVYGASFNSILQDKALAPVDVPIVADATNFRVKTWSSGHGFDNPTQCAEFCQRFHNISVNGVKRSEWLLWKECGDNPVYPQGGTWLIDRTAWCPGAPVDQYDHEITQWITPGKVNTIDYGIKPDTTAENWGDWVVSAQLIGYGNVNHKLDAAVDQIISPNTWELYSRQNPICGNPVIVIQNRGEKTLTGLKIEYGVDGAAPSTFDWKGSLPFLAKDTIALPIPAWGGSEEKTTFRVTVTAPNGGADEYAANDALTTTYEPAPAYYNDLTIALKTNNFANEQYSWSLKKIDGTTVASGSNLESNKLYELTYKLDDGCYEFIFENRLGYGLDFWFLRSQLGSGSLALRSGNLPLINFDPDFGNRVWHQFSVAPKPTIATSADTLDFGKVAPAGKATRTVRVTAANAKALKITKIMASSLKSYFTITKFSRDTSGGLTLQVGDTLEMEVEFSSADAGRRTGTLRIESNDMRTPTKTIRLVGEATTSSSVNDMMPEEVAAISVVPNPITDMGEAVIELTDVPSSIRLSVVDILGRTRAVVFDGVPASTALRYTMPEGMGAGTYTLVCETPTGITSVPFVVAR